MEMNKRIFILLDCKTTASNLKVISSSSNYQDTGVFTCEEGYYMKHLGSNIHNLNTECLKNSSWENEYLFQCWGGYCVVF